jgi:diketogulonate reductase-like aldo/keto reductase
VKAKVFDGVLANLGLLLRNFVLPPIKERKGDESLHTVLLSWSSQQEFIYILKECTAVLVG